MSEPEPLRDFVERFDWRFVPSAQGQASASLGTQDRQAAGEGEEVSADDSDITNYRFSSLGRGSRSGDYAPMVPHIATNIDDGGVPRDNETAVAHAFGPAVQQRGPGQVVHIPGQPDVVVQPNPTRGGPGSQRDYGHVQQPFHDNGQRDSDQWRAGQQAQREDNARRTGVQATMDPPSTRPALNRADIAGPAVDQAPDTWSRAPGGPVSQRGQSQIQDPVTQRGQSQVQEPFHGHGQRSRGNVRGGWRAGKQYQRGDNGSRSGNQGPMDPPSTGTANNDGLTRADVAGAAVDQEPSTAAHLRGPGYGGQIVQDPGQSSIVVGGHGRGHDGQDAQQPFYGSVQRGHENTRGGGRAVQQESRGSSQTNHPPGAHQQPEPHGNRGGARGIDDTGLRAVQESRRGGRGQVYFQKGPIGGRGNNLGHTQHVAPFQSATQGHRGGAVNTQPRSGPSGPIGLRGVDRGRAVVNTPTTDQTVPQSAQGHGTTRGGQQAPIGTRARGRGRGTTQQIPTPTAPAPQQQQATPAPQQQQAMLPNIQAPPTVPAAAQAQPQPLNLTGNPRNRPWAERWAIRQNRRREIDALDIDAAWLSSEFTDLRTQQPLPVVLPLVERDMREPIPAGEIWEGDVPQPAEVESSSISAENDLFAREDGEEIKVKIWNLVPWYRRL